MLDSNEFSHFSSILSETWMPNLFSLTISSFLIARFEEMPDLGLAGTAYTQDGWDSTKDSFEGVTSVHGACQLFRNECLLDIGGYVPNPAGGVDWIAVTTARMKGWKTRNFPRSRFHHHRIMGTAEEAVSVRRLTTV